MLRRNRLGTVFHDSEASQMKEPCKRTTERIALGLSRERMQNVLLLIQRIPHTSARRVDIGICRGPNGLRRSG
jgi:hypothetical protein